MQGTLMSFCHLCAGGSEQVDLRFHERNLELMRATLTACVVPSADLQAEAPGRLVPGQAWSVEVQTKLPLAAALELRWQRDGVAQGSLPMQAVGAGQYLVQVPGGVCGETLQARVWVPTQNCGAFLWPRIELQTPLQARVQSSVVLLDDNGVGNFGWASVPMNASAGFWARGQPVVDPNWPLAPTGDAGGDGWCFVTGNYLGNSDVDSGTVGLVSPAIQIQAWPASLEFSHYFGLVHETGQDRLVLEVSRSGPSGPWQPLWRTSRDSSGDWREASIPSGVLESLQWPAPLTLHLRFTARDGYPPSVVEAGIDSVRVFGAGCP